MGRLSPIEKPIDLISLGKALRIGYLLKAHGDLDLSRINAAPVTHLCGLSFEGQGVFPTQGWVLAARIVEAIEVLEDGQFG